ncbi:hypothetical protein AB0F72_31465 [Actinoplanes sp. NPDC023936]|uniref:hypothetical protein n=1 Tax=Actinoplanes sp. NPDC023936 TaxID=3154910 RepID=UPI0034083199
MMDLRHHLEDIAGPVTPVEAGQIDEDVLRGRRAVRQRRLLQTATGSLFAVGALVAAFTVPSGGVGAGPHGPTAAAPPAAVVPVNLVAYQGVQPKGFTIDKVPAGWFVQSDDNYQLTLALETAKNAGPDVTASAAPPHTAPGRISIYLESKDQNGPSRKGTEVTVGDRTGILVKSLPAMIPGRPAADPAGDTGWALWVEQPSGIWLITQFDEKLGMSQDQMIELATGVHVHETAVQGVG